MKQKIRTIGSVFAIIAMAVMATSCAKEELPENAQNHIPGVERTISASASLPQNADKAHLDEYNKVIWDLGDALNINGTNVSISSIGPNGTVAIFDKSTVHANTVNGTDHYWAVYPTTLAGAYSGVLPSEFTSTTSLTVHFPDTQIVNTASSALSGYTYMAAHASVTAGVEDVSFAMRNLGAVMKLTLQPKAGNASNRVDSLVFTSANASLAGTFTVSDDRENPTVTPTAGTDRLVVKFQDGGNKYIDITGGTTVYVILPPLASKNLKVRIYGTDAHYTEKNIASATLYCSRYYTSTISEIAFEKADVVGFSVAAGRKVYIAPGNLQWSATGGGATPTTHATADGLGGEGTWRFAEHQWDYIGYARANNYPEQVRRTAPEWSDIFGWGTSGYHDVNDPNNIFCHPYSAILLSYSYDQVYYDSVYVVYPDVNYNYYGYGPSSNMADPHLTGTSANYDWGVYNTIYNPKTGSTDPAGTWRTPTYLEWNYMIDVRTEGGNVNGTANPRYTLATVNTDGTAVRGLILFPDGYTAGTVDGVVWGTINSECTWASSTQCTSVGWAALEAGGCAFLPATGQRYGHTWFADIQTFGYYRSASAYNWSSSVNTSRLACHLSFSYDGVYIGGFGRDMGLPVRLVKDIH